MATQHDAKRIKHEKEFPGRYSWLCPDCGSWNRYFEQDCPACESRAYLKANPPVIVGGAHVTLLEATQAFPNQAARCKPST